MSVIAVSKIYYKYSLKQMFTHMAKVIKGQFEVLNFGPLNRTGMKVCYLRLSPKLEPKQVMADIKRKTNFDTFVPKTVPKFVLEVQPPPGNLPKRLGRRIPKEYAPDKLLIITHSEIMTELQSKYTGLFNLSKKTGHKLLEGIAETIFERLKAIGEEHPELMVTGFKLTQCYRRLHPHFGDFQLILATLHRLQDAAGTPRAHILESELATVSTQPYVVENIPYNLVQEACNKYSERIVKKVSEHIKNFKTEMNETDTEEDVARKKVREEMKKVTPYLPNMVKQLISNHFVPQKSPYQRIKIYGEPFMPTKDHMMRFVHRYRASKVMRSDRMYNVLRVHVPLAQYASILAMDGTVVGGAKLVIRPADAPVYAAQPPLIAAMRAAFGAQHPGGADDHETAQEEDWAEDAVF